MTSFTQDRVQAFIGAMHAGASRAASQMVEAIKPGEARALIDVGGASGTYTLAFLASSPQMKATLTAEPDYRDTNIIIGPHCAGEWRQRQAATSSERTCQERTSRIPIHAVAFRFIRE